MTTVSFTELLDAFQFTGFGTSGENAAYVCSETRAVYVTSSEVEMEEDLPEDLETSNRYLLLPSNVDLRLGRDLALRFTEQAMPDAYDHVADIFRRKGAFGRFRQLLEHCDVLERWYRFEESETESALRRWCEENDLQVGAGPA